MFILVSLAVLYVLSCCLIWNLLLALNLTLELGNSGCNTTWYTNSTDASDFSLFGDQTIPMDFVYLLTVLWMGLCDINWKSLYALWI